MQAYFSSVKGYFLWEFPDFLFLGPGEFSKFSDSYLQFGIKKRK